MSALTMNHALDELINACPDRHVVGAPTNNIADQRSLGPITQQVLHNAGFTTIEQLRELGSVAAYSRIKNSGSQVSLYLLWNLEGLISGVPWRVVARKQRHRLLVALSEFERENGIA
jgi:DNA transformation protein